MGRYSFSGHESFFCKPLWLKKAYDAMNEGVNFTSPDAVASLGVGKNMVASIRFWSRAFGLSINDTPTPFAQSVFDSEHGYDPFLENEGTLWLLHYYLLTKRVASLYHLTFLDFQREKREFDRNQLLTFVRRKCNVPEQKNVYNENTVKKDIGVLLHNYVTPSEIRSNEDFSAIFQDLGLINALGSAGTPSTIPNPAIFIPTSFYTPSWTTKEKTIPYPWTECSKSPSFLVFRLLISSSWSVRL